MNSFDKFVSYQMMTVRMEKVSVSAKPVKQVVGTVFVFTSALRVNIMFHGIAQ
jgi:hypothetical protein